MIVYGSREEHVWVAERITLLRSGLGERHTHGDITEVLLELGELESGIADAICAEADALHPALRLLRSAALAAGDAFCASRRADFEAARSALRELESALDRVTAEDLPESVRISVPEGYAFYGVYPECYFEAALRFRRATGASKIAVIGLRSIGTSLSAVIASALRNAGCCVRSYTVRPRGHSWDRVLALSSEFEAELGSLTGYSFAVVDEGPGLSGSSFASVARALSNLGVPDSRIVLFSSWLPEAQQLISSDARLRWARHGKFCVSFEEMPELAPESGAIDVSAGKWRGLVYAAESAHPAVQPQHERRKYLCGPWLLKFEGLGKYGRAKLRRAEALAEAGYSPKPAGLENGFLRVQFVQGSPLSAADATPELLNKMAQYLAFLRRGFRAGRPIPFDAASEMIRVNAHDDVAAGLDDLERFRGIVTDSFTTEIDCRMLPHEWIATARGFLKTDSLNHHDDHFFPGCQDIAWDLAGTCIEFGLSGHAADYLLDAYVALSGDSFIRLRLPFYHLAYSAYRLGYATLAANAIEPSKDADRFRLLTGRYAATLRAGLRSGWQRSGGSDRVA